MKPLSLAAAVFSFAWVTFTFLFLYRWADREFRARSLLRRLEPERERGLRLLTGEWFQAAVSRVLVPLGQVAAPRDEGALSALRRSMRQAGYRATAYPAVEFYFGLRVVLGLALGFLYLAGLIWGGEWGGKSLLYTFLPLSAGYYAPAAVLRGQASVRSKKIWKELPDVLDLLKICIEAGLSLDSALHRVSRELKDIAPVLSRELAQYFLEIQGGLPRKEVFVKLAERNQVNALTGVVNVLLQSTRLGTDIAEALQVYSVSLRTERMQAAEEQGARISTKLTFPMILFILPALLIVILGPALINMLERLERVF
ncbi:MAG: type II secretion system F family protein [Deltaproteobacteria bacterium]|nr:type II secretion system F family protein [Deltaproteobacteria bacterium]